MRRSVIIGSVLAMLLATAVSRAEAQPTGAIKLTYTIPVKITSVVTPNFQAGYGPQGGTGSGVSPSVGPLAQLQGGYVDFGSSVVAGYNYLYKYAAQVSVTSTDSLGYSVYGEGSTNFSNGATTWPVGTTLFWLTSGSSNTPFSAASPFNVTSGTPTNGGQNINYTSAPPSSSSSGSRPTSARRPTASTINCA